MRQIKFRAWDGKQMVTDFIRVTDQGHFIGHTTDSSEYTPMQYTGIMDKNGVEIYEGDIISCTKEYRHRTWNTAGENKTLANADVETTNPNGKVVFDRGEFRISCSWMSIRLNSLPEYYDRDENFHGEWSERYFDFEVIGNIHEHPHLLNT